VASIVINVGLIGFGLAGRYFHAPLIVAAGMRISAIVTSRTEEVRATVADAEVLAASEALFARDDVELVVIASPNRLHVPQAAGALLAGKHVVVDKPFSITAADARELAALARREDRCLAAFHNRRWDCDFLTIQKLIREARLGELSSYYARWDRYRPAVVDRWREREEPGAGVLYDLGVHLIDQALCLFGRFDWIQADVWSQRKGSVVDDAFELVLAQGTLRVSLAATSLAADTGWRYRINGRRASYLKSGFDPQEPQLRSDMPANSAQFGLEPREQWGHLTEGATGKVEAIVSERGRWTSFYEGMQQSIERGTPVPVSADEASTVIEIVEAAFESSRSGRRVHLAAPEPR